MALKKSEIDKFKQRLLEMKAQLYQTLRSVSEDVKTTEESRGYSQHQADEGTDDFDQALTITLSEREQTILRFINRSLEKIEEGTYGICDVTGEEIPIKRLEAIPYATMTVAAQDKFEKGLLG